MKIIEIEKIVLYMMLFLGSITDIRKKKVWIGFPMIASGAGFLCAIIKNRFSLEEFAVELGITAVFWLVSKVSKEALGMGDVWVIGSIILVTGVMEGMAVIFLAFLFAAIYGGVLWGVKKNKKDEAFPFVPFLFLGTLGGVWVR